MRPPSLAQTPIGIKKMKKNISQSQNGGFKLILPAILVLQGVLCLVFNLLLIQCTTHALCLNCYLTNVFFYIIFLPQPLNPILTFHPNIDFFFFKFCALQDIVHLRLKQDELRLKRLGNFMDNSIVLSQNLINFFSDIDPTSLQNHANVM